MTLDAQTTPTELVSCGGATRRHALAGLAAAAGALCAGCSSSGSKDNSGAPPTSQPAGGSTTAASSSSVGSSSPASSSGSSDGTTASSGSAPGAGGDALAPVSAVPVGGGKILADRQIVLTQPTAGDIKAFSAVCTHQGCTVASVDGQLITCPCHGSQYKITDGSVVTGPASRALAPHRVKVENGQILLVS
ncbi:Rieske (2Fe-2S) protein [Catenulispora subtropica]|uniref:Cytochrome bc1 complex Rieske iron-sulfur subunit n=1 Tax=Catenulispora subtropica TaxID=450798 RepID=A0ABN2QM05_9ACTN